jgi:hypothetical protein
MRHGGTPGPAVMEAEGRWADVASRNNYRAEFYEMFDECYRGVGRPLLNGEFTIEQDSCAQVRDPIEPPGGYDSQTRMALRGMEAFERIFSHPGVLGYTKYRWHGGGDKLWSGGKPQLPTVNRLRRANARAVEIATQWDRPQDKPSGPVHGQIFIALQRGAAFSRDLPAARPNAQPGRLISTGPIYIGLIARDGVWEKRVYGQGCGITGEVTEQKTEGDELVVSIKIKRVACLLNWAHGNAEYTIRLKRNGAKLEGAFTGVYNGEKVEGPALGYVHRPVPTAKL